MAVTRLERKKEKLRSRAAVRRQTLKNQGFMPVIKNVDVEEIKASFGKAESKA